MRYRFIHPCPLSNSQPEYEDKYRGGDRERQVDPKLVSYDLILVPIQGWDGENGSIKGRGEERHRDDRDCLHRRAVSLALQSQRDAGARILVREKRKKLLDP